MAAYLTVERAREIVRRQDPPGWGKQYDPSIRATREEAPGRSRATLVWSELLGRVIHTLSKAELAALLVVLYLACRFRIFEIHEQRMLPFNPSPHPLHGHPKAGGMRLGAFRGTLEIARDMGCLDLHPKVYEEVIVAGEKCDVPIPFPMIGDFLVFPEDDAGPYCVNLSVKKKRSDFTDPTIGDTIKTNKARKRKKAQFRTAIEEFLYSEVGIPTRYIAGDEVPEILVGNLEQLILWSKRKSGLDDDSRRLLLESLLEGLDRSMPAMQVLDSVSGRLGCTSYQLQIELNHAVWNHQLPVELVDEFFFIDQPMIRETNTVMERFGGWLVRGNQ